MKLIKRHLSRFGALTAAALLIGPIFHTSPLHAQDLAPPPTQSVVKGLETPQLVAEQDLSAGLQNSQSFPGLELHVPLETSGATVSDVDKLNLKYVKGVFTDTGTIFSSPLRWETQDWLKFGAIAGTTTGLVFLADQRVKNFAQSHQSPAASQIAKVGNDLGNGLYTLPAVGAFYLYGYLGDDHKARRTSLIALESFAISGLMTEGLKTLGGRHRPNTGSSPTTWDGPHFGLKNVSFCSGHTASAFSIATVFAEEYKDNTFVPPIAYGLATLTGVSRIYSNQHWLSDTFVGGAIGYFVSKALLMIHKEDPGSALSRLSLTPQVSKETNGLNVQYAF